MFPHALLLLPGICLVAACVPVFPARPAAATADLAAFDLLETPTSTPFAPVEDAPPPLPAASETPLPSLTASPAGPPAPSATPAATVTSLPATIGLDPLDWKAWPVRPAVPSGMRDIYELGQSLGNAPHAFSVFGDCQSEPGAFWGLYDTDAAAVAALPPQLQETVAWFAGSFGRESPTAQSGMTAGALLWAEWHRGRYGCSYAETPVACELRLHQPSFVFIHVGSHYEARNSNYLRRIIEQLLAAGVVPILVTKADNRERDERINAEYAALAVEYDIPLWNFWLAVDDLPNRGLYTRRDRPLQGNIYLTEQALDIHRLTGLQALDTVWRAVTGR
jgi:hypothetical protein